MSKLPGMIFIVLFVLISNANLSVVWGAPVCSTEEKFEFDYSDPGFKGNQLEINDAAYREFKRADDTLNKIYNEILVKYQNNQTFIDKLVDAELAWIKFRDAHLDSVYPEPSQQKYGSIYPTCYYHEKATLTWARVKQLNQWLEMAEGNPCLGSRGQYKEQQ